MLDATNADIKGEFGGRFKWVLNATTAVAHAAATLYLVGFLSNFEANCQVRYNLLVYSQIRPTRHLKKS